MEMYSSINNNNINYNYFHNKNNENNMIINQNPTQEKLLNVKNGYKMLFFNFLLFSLTLSLIILGAIIVFKNPIGAVFFSLAFIIFVTCCCLSGGFFQIDPNTAKVITYYGKYLGTVKKQGYYWINPFYSKKTVSLKSNNLLSEVIKVNDKQGNPIMMGCCVVWRVKDTAKAIFDVQNYSVYVRVQSESAIRYIGCMYPYDKTSDNENEICLRSGHEEINKVLKDELTERLVKAGIEVMEAKVTELSYAAEIANNMLKRQAAEAIIAAREKIVQGAVSITGHAIQSLKDNNIIELNEDEKSNLVANLITVLCSESIVSPIINAGHQ
jgi:regulator of protease activity HflC (stomatin/prohibitin superfamily)